MVGLVGLVGQLPLREIEFCDFSIRGRLERPTTPTRPTIQGSKSTAPSHQASLVSGMKAPDSPTTAPDIENGDAASEREPDRRSITPPSRLGRGPTRTSFLPGQSGNLLGRPRGFAGVAAEIMRQTRNGAELVEWALDVFRDTKRPHAERAAAHAWLADRGLGRPVSVVDLEVRAGDGVRRDFSHLSDAEIDEVLARTRGRLPIDVPSADEQERTKPLVSSENRDCSPSVHCEANPSSVTTENIIRNY